jgi:hypothetical protein
MPIEKIHIDGVGSVAMSGGVAYIELSQFEELPTGKGDTKVVPSHRISMSLDCLLKLHQALSGVTQQLEERGVIKRREEGGSPGRGRTKQ